MKIILPLLLMCSPILCSVPLKVSDKELAKKTDHVLVARVTGVEMVDAKGKVIKDPEARTGPGMNRLINLIVAIDEVCFTTAKKVPKSLKVPLDPFMHYSLGSVQKAHKGENRPFLLLLRGEKFQPSVPGVFKRPLDKKAYFVQEAKRRNTK